MDNLGRVREASGAIAATRAEPSGGIFTSGATPSRRDPDDAVLPRGPPGLLQDPVNAADAPSNASAACNSSSARIRGGAAARCCLSPDTRFVLAIVRPFRYAADALANQDVLDCRIGRSAR